MNAGKIKESIHKRDSCVSTKSLHGAGKGGAWFDVRHDQRQGGRIKKKVSETTKADRNDAGHVPGGRGPFQ